jgi:hypothetical protein
MDLKAGAVFFREAEAPAEPGVKKLYLSASASLREYP